MYNFIIVIKIVTTYVETSLLLFCRCVVNTVGVAFRVLSYVGVCAIRTTCMYVYESSTTLQVDIKAEPSNPRSQVASRPAK